MKKILKFLVLAIILLAGVVLYRTLTFKSPGSFKALDKVEVKADPLLLGRALTFETISHKEEMMDAEAFKSFHAYLDSVFPLTDSILQKEIINIYSRIYTWKGSDPSISPLVLMAHQDVVPVEYSTRDQWDYPPFSGKVTDKHIYGRGALDDKGSLVAILYAVESLLEKGFVPKRTIYLCFGHDEEIAGRGGARLIAQTLKERGIKAEMVLDEGGTLSRGIVPGIEKEVALIGTAEKGYVSLELSVDLPGGHSSMPEKKTALGILNEALYELDQNPFPNRLTEPLKGFVKSVGPELPFVQKMAFANTWMFKPLIFKVYQQSASGAALIHTTQVPTIFQSGIKDNIVPNRAKAVVNYRLLPGDEPLVVLERARKIIKDTNLRITILDDVAIPASPISPHNSEPFERLAASVKAIYPDAVVSPYLVLGATDGRYFYSISSNVYRFSPFPMEKEDLPRIHGINERVSIQGFQNSVSFYATLLKDWGNS
ncbi:MAG: M20 family peptidase [Owenweeksia sp.]